MRLLFISYVIEWFEMSVCVLRDVIEEEPAMLNDSREAGWQLMFGCVLVQFSWNI